MANRVLLVEDDGDIAAIVESIGVEEGWVITSVRNGVEAMARWQEEQHDLCVIDLHLPGEIDGVDILQQMRRELGGAPRAIILSAAHEAQGIANSFRIPQERCGSLDAFPMPLLPHDRDAPCANHSTSTH